MKQIAILDSATYRGLEENVNKKIYQDNMRCVIDIEVKNLNERWIATIIYDKPYNMIQGEIQC